MLSLSRSPALGPCGIPDDPDAGDELVDVEVAAGAGLDEPVEVDELEDPELPQPATTKHPKTSVKLASRRIDPDVALLIAGSSSRSLSTPDEVLRGEELKPSVVVTLTKREDAWPRGSFPRRDSLGMARARGVGVP